MLRITAMELFFFAGLFLLPLVNSAGEHVNMDNQRESIIALCQKIR